MSVKRKDIVKLFESNGFSLLREGGNHSIYTNGEKTIPLKRHKQFDRITANELCKQAGLGKTHTEETMNITAPGTGNGCLVTGICFAEWDAAPSMQPDRVVLGVESSEAADKLRELYSPFMAKNNRLTVMDVKSAKMTKYAANAMLATKISFAMHYSLLNRAA